MLVRRTHTHPSIHPSIHWHLSSTVALCNIGTYSSWVGSESCNLLTLYITWRDSIARRVFGVGMLHLRMFHYVSVVLKNAPFGVPWCKNTIWLKTKGMWVLFGSILRVLQLVECVSKFLMKQSTNFRLKIQRFVNVVMVVGSVCFVDSLYEYIGVSDCVHCYSFGKMNPQNYKLNFMIGIMNHVHYIDNKLNLNFKPIS